MSTELELKDTLKNFLENKSISGMLAIGLLLLLSGSAFSLKTKQVIRQRDGNRSTLSGKKGKLHAAHINHDKTHPRYDDASNGRLLTVEEHLMDHVNREGRNGLTKKQNRWAISMLLKELLG